MIRLSSNRRRFRFGVGRNRFGLIFGGLLANNIQLPQVHEVRPQHRHGIKPGGFVFLVISWSCGDRLLIDFLLKGDQAVDQSLGSWRASWNVHVDRQELVDPVDYVVTLLEWPTA